MNQKSNNRIIQISSTIAFFIGLTYSGFLLTLNVFKNRTIDTTEVQILAVLMASGLLGNVLNYILKKIVKDQIQQYITSEKLRELVDEQLEEIHHAETEESNTNEIVENSKYDDLNTVIVPVQNTLDSVKLSRAYVCPDRYQFKQGLEFIAFYKEKKIVGYGKLVHPNNYNNSINGVKRFEIEEFISKVIPHKKKGAFVQNKMYCNIDKLRRANSTEDIR